MTSKADMSEPDGGYPLSRIQIQFRLETVAKKRALCTPGHLMGADQDKTRLSEGATERARASPTRSKLEPCT
jgi:hypothetical protein